MTETELKALIDKILNASPDCLSFVSGDQEKFEFIAECQRVIKELRDRSKFQG